MGIEGSSLGPIAIATGGITSSIGSITEGVSQFTTGRTVADIQQQTAEFNARMAQLQAKEVKEISQTKEIQIRKRARQIIGRQRTGFANQGVKVGVGTPQQVAESTLAEARLDENVVRANAWRQAFGYETEALRTIQAGRLAAMTSRQKADAGLLTGGLDAVKTLSSLGYFFGSEYGDLSGKVPSFDPADADAIHPEIGLWHLPLPGR